MTFDEAGVCEYCQREEEKPQPEPTKPKRQRPASPHKKIDKAALKDRVQKALSKQKQRPEERQATKGATLIGTILTGARPEIDPKTLATMPYVAKRYREIDSIQNICKGLKLPIDAVDDLFEAYCLRTGSRPVDLVGLHHALVSKFFQDNSTTPGKKPPDRDGLRAGEYEGFIERHAGAFFAELVKEEMEAYQSGFFAKAKLAAGGNGDANKAE